MNDPIKMLFIDNPDLDELLRDFCAQDPEYLTLKDEFYETAHKIKEIIGYDLYNCFEQRFGLYVARANELHYLFGLGLRQEILSALQSEMP